MRAGPRFRKKGSGRIPKEWDSSRIGAVIRLASGTQRPKEFSEFRRDDYIFPIFGGNGVVGYSTEFNNGARTVVIGRVGQYCGNVYDTQGPAWITDNALYAKEILREIDVSFLALSLAHLRLNRLALRSGQPLITQTSVCRIPMAVPPLPEQQKIASILSTVDDAIHKTDEIIAKSRQLKKGLMQQLLTKGIGHTKFQKTEIGEIPEEWEVVRLGGGEDVSQIIMGQSPPSSTYNEDGTGLPFIQGNAEFGEVYPEPRMHTSNPIKVAEKNDILVSVRAPVGDVNLSPFRCCIGRGLSAVRTDPSRLNHLFTFHYMKNTTNRLTSLAMGSTFMAVRKDDLESFKISLPSLPEQERIASILSTADSNTHSEGWRREKLMEVKKGLMQVLLTGKVRVKVI